MVRPPPWQPASQAGCTKWSGLVVSLGIQTVSWKVSA